MEEEDLSMQIGWNQLFQQFVSDLFVDTEERNAPVVTIDNLDKSGRGIGNVLHTLSQAVDFVRTKYARRFSPAQLPETNHLSVLAEGLALYLNSALSTPQYEALSAQLSAAAIHWLKSFMRLDPNTRGSFTRDEGTGRQFACRVALHNKFPNYEELGYQALTGQPIFYYTSSFMSESFHALGLPSSSFRQITSSEQLEKFIVEDQAQERVPVMILACVGSGVTEQLSELRAVSQKHGLLMHAEGDDLAMLLTKDPPKFLQTILSCECFTISPGEWYGLASSSTCTFLKSGLQTVRTEKEKMFALPLWLTMQYVGQDRLISIISKARVLSREMVKLLSNSPSVITHSSQNSLSVLFRYEPVTKPARLFHKDFLNSLNSQVLIDLSETAVLLHLDMMLLENCNCMRFRPLFAPELSNIEPSDVRAFVDRLGRAIECINATLSCAPDFEEEAQTHQGLQCVHVRNFVGIGAVRYLPNFLRGVNLAPEVSQEVDAVNSLLAKELAKQDVLFSEGTTTEGKICVCLGVETKTIDNNSPVHYTCAITEKIEELGLRRKIEEKFGEILAQGIQAAEKHMKVENELAEVQQGIFRSIPVVGSMVNWWSPVEKKVHGKSFDIGSTALRNVVLSPSAQKKAEGRTSSESAPSTPSRTSSESSVGEELTPIRGASVEAVAPPSPSISEKSEPLEPIEARISDSDQPSPIIPVTDDEPDLPKPEPLPLD